MNDIKPKILDFLYQWTQENKLPHIRKGMVEDLEAFIALIMAQDQADKTAYRLNSLEASKEPSNAQDSK